MTQYYGLEIDYGRDSLLTPEAINMLTEFYSIDGEKSPQEMYARASRAWAHYKGVYDGDLAQRLYDYVSKKWFMFASPVLSNAPDINGKKRGLPISCFLGYVPDTIPGLIDHSTELRWLSVMGGGVGGHWKDVRTASKKAPGPMPFLHTVDADMSAYKQGSNRRGSYAAYMDIDHPDILEFINMRVPTGDVNRKAFNLHNAVNLSDSFMQKVINGEKFELVDPAAGPTGEFLDARKVFEKLIEIRSRTGEPYMHFIDTANRALPQTQKDLGLKINGSNLCVHGDTLILTDKGNIRIADVAGTVQNVWNGYEFSSATVAKTGIDKRVIKVTLSNGMSLICTPEHDFYDYKDRKVKAKDLVASDKLNKCYYPTIEGTNILDEAYTNGFYTGDGYLCPKQGPRIYLYHEKMLLEHRITGVSKWYEQGYRKYGHNSNLREKYFVPDASFTIESRLDWLAGLLDADGAVSRNGENESVQLVSANPVFIRKLQLMLTELGCSTTISNHYAAGEYLLPDGNGGEKLYNCKNTERIFISGSSLNKLSEMGLFCSRLVISGRAQQREAGRFPMVASVEEWGTSDTYCFNEPLRHRGVFNGILTGQCIEIELATSEDRTAVCCLSSPNLELYDEWKDTSMIADLVTMLDNVLEYFIENAPQAIWRAVNSAKRERAIGLGGMGWHNYLQSKSIPFESVAALIENTRISRDIKTKARNQSLALGASRGEAPDMTGTGHRHSHSLAYAPNASSGFIVGTSPSAETNKANAYVHRTRAGSTLVINQHLKAILAKIGKDTDEVWKDIILNEGSVQHLPFLSDHNKKVFRTSFEIDQKWVVEHAAERQKSVCQGQSVNLFFPAGASKSYILEVHLAAWQKKLKGLYYFRTESKQRAEKISNSVERVRMKEDDRTIIYGRKNCPYCEMAKNLFDAKGVPYSYVDIEIEGKTAAEVTGRDDVRTVPQIYINGEYIGGYKEAYEKLSKAEDTISDDECKACEG